MHEGKTELYKTWKPHGNKPSGISDQRPNVKICVHPHAQNTALINTLHSGLPVPLNAERGALSRRETSA
jgi:hypothetical protein